MAKINSRAKGKAGERELIGELKRWLPDEMTSELTRNLDQTRDGGHDILGLDGWAIEVKRYAQVLPADLERFWVQTTNQARNNGALPVLCFREDRKAWRVVLRLADVMEWHNKEGWKNLEVIDEYWMTCEMSLNMFTLMLQNNQRYKTNV